MGSVELFAGRVARGCYVAVEYLFCEASKDR
jgi:hypothetical protein